jgi:hypothetical protein
LDEETQNLVKNAIQGSIENGNLASSDNRFLDVTWSMHVDPDGGGDGPGGGDGGGGGDNGGGGNGGGGDNGGGNNGGGGDPNGGNGDIDRADTTGGGLEPWAWALVVIGGIVFLTLIYFCLQRPRRQVGTDEPDVESSSKKSSSHQSQSESVEDKDTHMDEYDESRATPLIQNTSAKTKLGSTGPIEEESEGDISHEDSKASRSGPIGSSQNSHSSSQSGSESESYQDIAPAEYDLSEMSREMQSQEPQKYVGQPAPTEEASDSAYSSYEDVVEEEYEIEYVEGSQRSGNWADGQEEYAYEGNDNDNSAPAADASLPMLAHNSQRRGSSSSFDAMRRKWEGS